MTIESSPYFHLTSFNIIYYVSINVVMLYRCISIKVIFIRLSLSISYYPGNLWVEERIYEVERGVNRYLKIEA